MQRKEREPQREDLQDHLLNRVVPRKDLDNLSSLAKGYLFYIAKYNNIFRQQLAQQSMGMLSWSVR